jgi:hypothetical protein
MNLCKKGKPRIPPRSSDPVSAFVAFFYKNYGFPLVAALVLVLVMVIMCMLMDMFLNQVLVFVAIVLMSHLFVFMLVLMLILIMAAHLSSPPLLTYIILPE